MADLKIHALSCDLESEFRRIAEELMLSHVLKTPKNGYRLAEVEFYLDDNNIHPDKSTHCDPRQMESGLWYFHRHENGTFKQANRQGLDITFGMPGKYYAGILVRAIQNVNDAQDYIYGPSIIVDRIKEECGFELNETEKGPVFENKLLQLAPGEKLNEEVLGCPRHNLGKNTPVYYREKAYRFIIYPTKKHAGKEKTIFPFLRERLNDDEKIKKLFGRKTM